MVTAVTVAGLVLAALAACDRRTWPFVGVIALAWAMTWRLDQSLPVLAAIWARVFVDALGALLAWGVEGRSRPWAWWMGGVRVTFVLMLLAHGVFWMARHLGLDLWLFYAHGLNVLTLAQLVFVAGPGGRRLARFLLDRVAGAGAGPAGRASAPGRAAPAARSSSSHVRHRRPHG